MKSTGLLILLALLVPRAARGQRSPNIAELEARARADSNDPVAHYALAVAYVKERRAADAERALRQAVSIDPQYVPGLLLLGHVIRSRTPLYVLFKDRGMVVLPSERADEAARLLRRAFLIDPFVELRTPRVEELPVAWRGSLRLALHHYERARMPEALAAFQQVIDQALRQKDSTRIPAVALWYHARTAAALSHYDAAVRDLRALIRRVEAALDDADPVLATYAADDVRYALAYLCQVAGRSDTAATTYSDTAAALYQELLERNLGLYMAHAHLAELHGQAGRWGEAVAERRLAIAANPEDPSLVFDLASTLAQTGANAEAEKQVSEYLRANPRESRAHYLLGLTLMRQQKYAEARAALIRYLELAPRRYEAQIADARWRLASLQ